MAFTKYLPARLHKKAEKDLLYIQKKKKLSANKTIEESISFYADALRTLSPSNPPMQSK